MCDDDDVIQMWGFLMYAIRKQTIIITHNIFLRFRRLRIVTRKKYYCTSKLKFNGFILDFHITVSCAISKHVYFIFTDFVMSDFFIMKF